MTNHLEEIVRRLCRPLEAIPTGEEPVLPTLSGIRAVLFDIYGTLFISSSGDVGTDVIDSHGEAFTASLESVGMTRDVDGQAGVECLLDTIRNFHAHSRDEGIEFPEVDIVEVWKSTLKSLQQQGLISHGVQNIDLKQLAVEYECRTNPAWPMPDGDRCLRELHSRSLLLGIVSNAQFFTHELFPALMGAEPEELGFHADLQFYSYRYGQAKPGKFLYEQACTTLNEYGIEPKNVLYVGNDMLKDIFPASQVGFRTALFAGDRRSLRLRAGDERLEGITPELVLTDLAQLPSCLKST